MSQSHDNGHLLEDKKDTNGKEYKGPPVHDNGRDSHIETEYSNVISNINSAISDCNHFIINDSSHCMSDSQSVDEAIHVTVNEAKSNYDDNEKSKNPSVKTEDVTESVKKDLNADYLDGFMTKNLTTSMTNLENNDSILKMNKSPLSKSAENLSIQSSNQIISRNHSTSNSETLNKDEILENFISQKTRAAATQKIVPDHRNEPTNLDNKYGKKHKDILTPDLGYLVKNVHGIFSSVSGSLKNAYNMSHKVSYHTKPVNNLTTMSNGNVFNDIFDDHQNGKSLKDSINRDVKAYTDDVVKIEIESSDDGKSDCSEVYSKEMIFLKHRLQQQAEELQIKNQALKDLEGKMESLHQNLEQVKKEKDMAVMRYASVECGAIEARKVAEAAAKAQKAATAEVILAENKLKVAQAERRRLCQMYDDKCHELSTSERELAKTREELKELEGRLKWTQSKLRLEADAYKESAEKAERLAARVAELEAGRDSAAAAHADAARMKQQESELKESQASLILARHQAEELEKKLTSTHQQLTSTQQELSEVKTALAKCQVEVVSLRNSNASLEQEAAELAALRARAALADTLTSQLQRETERAALAEEALSKERARADTCARREAAALEHAARLTAHHVAQRAQTDHEKDKATALAADNTSLRETVMSLKVEIEELKKLLAAEESRRMAESKTLARRVAELTEELSTTNEKLEWERAENGLLKKRHATALKEVNRELQRTLKRCEQLEAKVPHDHDESIRTGSVSSLSSDGTTNHHHHNHQTPEVSSSPDDVPTNGQNPEPEKPDRQALIERIVQLQRSLARRADRCEFLEEHARHLTAELRRKSKLLRHALPALPAGALPTAASDRHKKEVAALGGGAMAAVWGAGDADADALSPQLALEMNRRLHAVLEDALLKNITLKENLDTLGEEIARLKSEKATH